MPQDRSDNTPTVEEQEKDSRSLLNVTRQLVDIHTSEKALRAYADIKILYAKGNLYPFICKRTLDDENILVILNPSSDQVTVEVEFNLKGKELKLLLGDGTDMIKEGNLYKLNCSGKSYSIYKY